MFLILFPQQKVKFIEKSILLCWRFSYVAYWTVIGFQSCDALNLSLRNVALSADECERLLCTYERKTKHIFWAEGTLSSRCGVWLKWRLRFWGGKTICAAACVSQCVNTPPLLCPQFAAWVDAVVFVFSLEDEISFQTVYNYFLRLSSYRNTAEVPMVLVGTQGACPTSDICFF